MLLLGRGTHAVVFTQDGRTAVKIFRPRALAYATSALAQQEFLFAQRWLTHPNIVRVLELDLTKGSLAMEYVDGGSLADLLDREGALAERCVVRVLAGIIAGLCRMHEHYLLHRDVKPGNILIDLRTGASKLTDWIGLGAETASLLLGKPVGTPVFMAPEVAGKPHRHKVASDTWSLGCTVVNIASGQLPWAYTDAHGRTNEFTAMWLTAQGKPPPYDASGWSPALAAFVARCFEPDPCKRPHAQDLRNHAVLCES
jgi:serine/threonine protein kinase